MPQKRPIATKKQARSAQGTPEPLALVALLTVLALSAVNFWLMALQANMLFEVNDSFQRLQRNYARMSETVAPPPEKAAKSEREPLPALLFSIAGDRGGEETSLRARLAEPLVAFYAETRWPVPLAAALVERRNPSSRDVNVRLFFSDGSEQSYLWPSTHAKDGKWVPPCTSDLSRSSPDLPICPTMFSARYPDLVELTR